MRKTEIKQIAKEFSELAKELKMAKRRKEYTIKDPLKTDMEYDNIRNVWYKKHDYEELERLGSGQFGVTSLVKNVNTGKNYVLKAIKLNDKNLQEIYNEVYILKKIVKHGCKNNLLCFIEYFVDYENNIMYIITDVFENSMTLAKFINGYQERDEIISTFKLLKIIKGLLKAIVYLHKIGIAHADIKPENILINDKLEIQIIDFGISCAKKCVVLGTLLYQSPELIRVIGSKQKKSVNVLKRGDIFSLGMVFYLLANLSFPYPLDGDYILNKKSKYTENLPMVRLSGPALLFSLNNFYVKVGGFLTEQDRKRLKESGKEEPKNLMESHYSDKFENIDKSINKLIIDMLNPNVEKRPLAKNCMSKLNKIIRMYNDIYKSTISPGIESPIIE
jgi:serine/threonine protein kinase